MGQYSGSSLMWCQQYDTWMSDVQMSRWCDLPRPAWSVQRDGFKNVPIQPGGSRCCTHLMNISLITTHQTKHQVLSTLDSNTMRPKNILMSWLRLCHPRGVRVSSWWCLCMSPCLDRIPPSLPQYVKTPGVTIWDPSEGQRQQWKVVWKRMSYISAFKPAVNIGTNPMDFTLYSTVCCEFCKLLDHFRYQRPLLTKRLSGPSSRGRDIVKYSKPSTFQNSPVT